jgi:GMP synthase (glutamine-hydrolysing)
MQKINYLLIQARQEKDPMRQHEQMCFARSLKCDIINIKCVDIIRENISKKELKKIDVVIVGGSGDFSIAKGGEWMPKVLDFMNYLYEYSKTTFASCWGFQAMARAKGGEVMHDLKEAELGTTELWLTEEGKKDDVFKNLPTKFFAQMGHEDIVKKLPKEAVLLASSKKVKNEAFKFKKKPIYCTQFHPELNKNDLKKRMEIYPEYVTKILGISQKEFLKTKCMDSTDTDQLMINFIRQYIT